MSRRQAVSWLTPVLAGCWLVGLCCAIGGGGSAGAEEAALRRAERSDEIGAAVGGNDYPLIPLPALVGMADLAVTGEVTDEDEATFLLRIDALLIGDSASDEVRVEKYVPPALVGRQPVPYAGGQRFTLFLRERDAQGVDRPYVILGFGGEGEMRVEGEFVYIAPYDLEGLEYWPVEVEGVAWKSQRLDLEELEDAVKRYGGCFAWELVEYVKNEKLKQRLVVSRTCDDRSLEAYRARGWLHEYLAQESVRRTGQRVE